MTKKTKQTKKTTPKKEAVLTKADILKALDKVVQTVQIKQPKRGKGQHFFNVANLSKASPEQRHQIIAHIVDLMDEEDKTDSSTNPSQEQSSAKGKKETSD